MAASLLWAIVLLALAALCLPVSARGRGRVLGRGGAQGGRACVSGDGLLPAGARFRPDPCTSCRCPRKGGRPVCSVEDCRAEPNCLRVANGTSRARRSCCPKCVEYGCRHTDGRLYRRGELISRDGCSRCYCPPAGGQATCDVLPCPPAMCVDFVHRPGSCCPWCPRGPNCQLGMRVIGHGSVVTSASGALCRCRLKRRGHNWSLEADCQNR